ncbi:hypothetical protein CHUAL_000430 [Chamberlinius hualienensis]
MFIKSQTHSVVPAHVDVEDNSEKESHEKTNPFHPLFWGFLIIIGVFSYGSYSVLMHLCEKDNKIPFSSASVVLTTEMMKLLLSFWMSTSDLHESLQHLTFKTCLPFSVPAVLYCVNNNMAVHMQVQMDPATFQILSNLKIMTTAVLYWLMIKRPLTAIQWISLLLLTVAGASHSYGSLVEKEGNSGHEQVFITWPGLILMVLYCIISGFAGVYCELILKKDQKMSLAMQNVVLYVFGVVCNGVLYVSSSESLDIFGGFFHGYTIVTWVIIVTQAINGLIMSAIMKHSSNITRLFVISSAMIVTTGLSVIMFHMQLNAYLVGACVVIILALFLYHMKPSTFGFISKDKSRVSTREM